MTTTIDIAPEILDWIFRNVTETAENQKAYFYLEKWRKGEKTPTFNKVEEVSRTLHVPFGYFFLRQPPKEDYSFLQYRTIQKDAYAKPSRELIDTIHDMVSIQDWMHEYVKRTDAQPIQIVGSGKGDSTVEALATRIRSDLDIESNWYETTVDADSSFKYLREKGEAVGIIIMMNGIVGNSTKRSLKIEEFRAFTLVDDYAPLIFINATDTKNGRLFSLVHEMVHVWLGQNSVYNNTSIYLDAQSFTETKCNAVAAEILVPKRAFTSMWINTTIQKKTTEICRLARYFKCSTVVIARRALEQNYITKVIYDEVVAEAIEKSCTVKAKSPGGDYYATLATRIDTRLLFALANSISNGTTLYTEAYKLTKTSRVTFSKLLESVRG